MRILSIGHSYVVSGNRVVLERLGRRGVEVTIAAPRWVAGDLRPIELEPRDGAPYELVGLPAHLTGRNHVLWYGGLGQLLEPGRFDLVHVWEEPYVLSGFQCARAAERARTPFFFKTDQNLVKRYPQPFRFFERYCTERARGWVACGKLVYESRLLKGYPARNATTIPYAVDDELFRPDVDEGAAVCRELGLERPVIGFVGRLTLEKGVRVLLDALDRVDATWSLLVLGSGPERATIEAWAKERKLEARVRVRLARHGEVPRYLRAMDFLVAPSQTRRNWTEQFGRMIIEAFATGVPVIGSTSGEIPHVIGDAGAVVQEDDVQAWAQAIAAWTKDASLRRAFAAAALRRCRETFAADRVADRYLEYYRRLIDEA